jgi:hypothetical protein
MAVPWRQALQQQLCGLLLLLQLHPFMQPAVAAAGRKGRPRIIHISAHSIAL